MLESSHARTVLMLVGFVGCGEQLETTTQAVVPACRTVTLEATLSSSKQALDGEVTFESRIVLAIPATLEAVRGDSNNNATLELDGPAGKTTCRYRGAVQGSSYDLVSCTQNARAGMPVSTTRLQLSVLTADRSVPQTTVRATLLEVTPCAPRVDIDSPVAGEIVGPDGNATFTTVVAGDVSFECDLDGAITACGSPFAWHGLRDGTHTLRIRGTDRVTSLTGEWSTTTFQVDAQKPAIQILGFDAPVVALDIPIVGRTNRLRFEVTDAAIGGQESSISEIRCSLDGYPSLCACSDLTCELPLEQTFGDNLHVATITAVDRVGNTSEATQQFFVDAESPLVFFAGNECFADSSLPLVSASPTLRWTAIDLGSPMPSGLSIQRCTLYRFTDGIASLPALSQIACDGEVSYTGLVEGSYRLLITVIDRLGNSAQFVEDFSVDGTAPVIELLSPVEGQTIDVATIQFGMFATAVDSSTAAQHFTCTIDGRSQDCSSLQYDIHDLANGLHHVQIQGTDCAGNISSSTMSFSVCTQLADGDGCCPPTGTPTTDSDCIDPCGNGLLDPGEQCDDGNTDETDSCRHCQMFVTGG